MKTDRHLSLRAGGGWRVARGDREVGDGSGLCKVYTYKIIFKIHQKIKVRRKQAIANLVLQARQLVLRGWGQKQRCSTPQGQLRKFPMPGSYGYQLCLHSSQGWDSTPTPVNFTSPKNHCTLFLDPSEETCPGYRSPYMVKLALEPMRAKLSQMSAFTTFWGRQWTPCCLPHYWAHTNMKLFAVKD